MTVWAQKRFWKTAGFSEVDDGFRIELDGRPIATPAKRSLIVPTDTIAARIAGEWQSQVGRVDPASMPWTRSANAALDKVALQREETEKHLAGYAATDLVCYRATAPEALVRRQSETWDPILDWASRQFGARLEVARGVMPVAQETGAVSRLAEEMPPMSDFQLTGFHDMVTVSGSFLIALASAYGADTPANLFAASCLDEAWQTEQWGRDEEAEMAKNSRESAFLHATEFFRTA